MSAPTVLPARSVGAGAPHAGALGACRTWPADVPLTALVSADSSSPRWSRRSLLAIPESSQEIHDPAEALERLEQLLSIPGDPQAQPFRSGWVLVLGYDLVRALEPKASALPRDGSSAIDDREWPALILQRVGDSSAPEMPAHDPAPATVRMQDPSANRTSYEKAVRRTVELIHAGDIFQANIAHRLSARVESSPRDLAIRFLESASPWFGAIVESPESGRSIACASPELFLHYDPASRRVITRPIKGTRPGDAPADELLHAPKDTAELAMIIDLMRNDLGRVCEYGSVRVEAEREIEAHARTAGPSSGVRHAVATVAGTLREDRTPFDLVCAAFPPGSITGAPKVRAMQVIDAFEPCRRGPHFGAIGFLSDSGELTLNVAIRTAAFTPDAGAWIVDLMVGAGIVADSDPESEWNETLAKAGAFLSACDEPGGTE